jgi:hypothetical protein
MYASCSNSDFSLLYFATLEFTCQKNQGNDKVIGIGCISKYFLPVYTILCRIQQLHVNAAPPDTPLASYFQDANMYHITPKQITMALHSAIATSEPSEPSFM